MKTPKTKIKALFRDVHAMDLATIRAGLAGRAVRSVYRDLAQVGYMSSFTDRGRFYTLASIPDFDEDGLWFHGGVGFSRVGTLKDTVVAVRLSARGTAATGEQVTRVYTEFGLVPGKKTVGPPSGHSQS